MVAATNVNHFFNHEMLFKTKIHSPGFPDEKQASKDLP
jgi:hypothetical protein